MRGGIDSQVNHLFLASGIFTPGLSKHQAKQKAREDGARTWAQIGQRIDLYGYDTADEYKGIWHSFGRFAKSECGLKDIEKVNGDHIREFLQWKAETVAVGTFGKTCSALAKLENALNKYAKVMGKPDTYNLRPTISQTKRELRGELRQTDGRHAYKNPLAVRRHIKNSKHQIAADIMHEGGARVSGVDLIKSHQLRGIDEKNRGVIYQEKHNVKGGRTGYVYVSPKTYRRLESVIEDEGEFKINRDAFRADIRQACERLGEVYSGSHAFRHNFAQETMDHLQSEGLTFEEALAITADLLFHSRPDIVLHYLP